MKRQAGGTAPGSSPADAMDVMRGAAAGAGPTGYASAGDPAAGGAELLEDRTLRITGGGHGRRFGLSMPGAVAGTFLVVALAFGAAMGPLAGKPANDSAGNGGVAISEPTDKPDGGGQPEKTAGVDEPAKTDDAAEPETAVVPDATPKTEPTAAPAPASTEIEIGVALEGTGAVVEWSACSVDGFVAYKVIRSKDQYATWPLGSGDTLASAIGDAATLRFVDAKLDAGRTYTYRIVALRQWNGETVVACSSVHAAVTTPAPTPKPEPVDTVGSLSITVALKEGRPFIEWTPCTGVDFDYYKVVRSADSMVTWPKGANDALVAAVGVDGKTKAWDSGAPGGTTVFYAVFCVRSTEAGYLVLAASPVKGIETPVVEPAPAPVALGFEAAFTGEGVTLHWEGCTSDAFAFYKVVRSLTNSNPSYLPGTDGTEIIGVIENQGTTQLVDMSVASGQTIYYRVQAIGYWYGQKILLGQTAVIAVTIP